MEIEHNHREMQALDAKLAHLTNVRLKLRRRNYIE